MTPAQPNPTKVCHCARTTDDYNVVTFFLYNQNKQNSSVEGIFPAAQRPSHPFRIIEHDAMSIQSMTSLGRVGRILAGSLDAASLSGGSVCAPLPATASREPPAQTPATPAVSVGGGGGGGAVNRIATGTTAEPMPRQSSPVQKINFSGKML